MVNPVWLKTFCTLVDVGTFTKAADKCYMTQSGVSQHVRKLEDSLSSTLVIRGKKGVVLTEAGQQLYRQGKDVLQTLDNLAVTISRDPGYEGEVRIMSPGSVGLRLYTRLLDLQVTYPALTINYRFAPNGDVHKAILNNTIDIGLTTACPVDPNIQSEPIGEEPLLLVTPRHIKDLHGKHSANLDSLITQMLGITQSYYLGRTSSNIKRRSYAPLSNLVFLTK
ncbi:LysR family transcriptional regulator [Salinivibrio costicola]|uniref:LysR family transcriptional regulator n=1 Tax=Salinivibrio costicola TaxID=51367 RepID=UPI000A487099|nr:LysR family transcriptional regulator [Salinivibrio costicola]